MTSSHTAPSPSASHGQMLRHSLAPARLRESFALNKPPSVRNAAIAGGQSALAVVLAATALHASPWPELAGFGGLGALAALFGRFATPSARRRIVFTASLLLVLPIALLALLASTGIAPVPMLLLFSVVAGLLSSISHRTRIGAPGAVIFVFAASAAIAPMTSETQWLERTLATAFGALLAWLACALTDHLRDLDVPLAPPPAKPGKPATSALQSGYAPAQAIRITVCAAIAALIAYAMHWSHPAWASIGAVAILQGAHLHGTVHRAWQRTLGTILGAGIAWLILSNNPSFTEILIAVAILQFLTEIIIGFNYALGQVTITPMALLMTTLSSHSAATDMAVSRIYDTALGALVGIAFALLLSTMDERLHLARHHTRDR